MEAETKNIMESESRRIRQVPQNDDIAGDSFGTFKQSLGLRVLTFFSFKKEETEPPKVFIRKSALVALLHCSVHIIPSAVSIFLIVWNMRGYFVGGGLNGTINDDQSKQGTLTFATKAQQGLLQLAAKLQVSIQLLSKSLHVSSR